jgi:hypothetical protein
MKYYTEILHPTNNNVLWHYYLEAPDEETARKAIANKVVKEHSDGFLLDTGGLFMLILEEDKEEEHMLNIKRIAEMSDEEVYRLSVTSQPSKPEAKGFRLSHRRFETKEEMAECMNTLLIRLEKIIQSDDQEKMN